MKITFDRGLLADAIDIIKIAEKDEGLLSAVSDGGAELQARDENVAISAATICKVMEPGEAVIDMKRLRAIANASDAPSIEISSINDYLLQVQIGKSKYRIPTIDPQAFARTEIDATDMIELANPEAFAETLTWAAPACDKTPRVISGIGLRPDDCGLRVCATDGKRLLEQIVPSSIAAATVLPVKAALALAKIIDKREDGAPVYIASSERAFRMTTTGVKVQTSVLNDQYPDYMPIIKNPAFDSPTSTVVGPAGKIEKYLTRAALSRPQEPQVWFAFAANALRLMVGTTGEPDFDETIYASPEDGIEIVSTGNEPTLQYNAWHLKEALALFDDDSMVKLEFTASGSPARLTTAAHPGFTLVTMPFPIAA